MYDGNCLAGDRLTSGMWKLHTAQVVTGLLRTRFSCDFRLRFCNESQKLYCHVAVLLQARPSHLSRAHSHRATGTHTRNHHVRGAKV